MKLSYFSGDEREVVQPFLFLNSEGSLMKRLRLFITTGLVLGLASMSYAATIQVQSDPLDYEAIRANAGGTLSTSNGVGADNRIGQRQTSNLSSSILPFALPAIVPGEVISTATLTVRFVGENASLKIEATDGNVDLYGLPYEVGGPTQDANRYYSGASDLTVGVTKLQDDIMTPAMYPAEGVQLTVVSVDVSAYLTSLYASGAAPGDFAILRLSYDVAAHNTTNNRYRVLTTTGDGTTQVSSIERTIADGAPHLTIETVAIPEPTTIALAAMAGLGIVAFRRRK